MTVNDGDVTCHQVALIKFRMQKARKKQSSLNFFAIICISEKSSEHIYCFNNILSVNFILKIGLNCFKCFKMAQSGLPILETNTRTNQKVLKSKRMCPDMILRNRYSRRNPFLF